MRRLLSRQGIRYTCRLLAENSKRAFLMLVTKIQRPKILKWKKKSINNKTNKQTNASLKHDTCVYVFDESVVGASNTQIHSEGKGRIPVSVACFNYSIAKV